MDTHNNTMAHKPLEELKITIEYKELIALYEEAQQQAHALQALFS